MFDEPEIAGPQLAVHPSIAVELDWALSAAYLPSKPTPQVLLDLYEHDPDLAARVRGLWGPDETLTYPGFLELSAIAHAGGVLFTADSGDLLGHLEELCLKAPEDLAFRSEKAGDGDKLRRRLDMLRTSDSVRRNYVAVVREVWARLSEVWEAEGRAAVRASVAARRLTIERGISWVEFARNECKHGEHLDVLVEALAPGGQLVAVPAFFTRKGLIVDLPGLVVVGVRTDLPADLARARTETLARRLKALSDPTRLAILDALARREMTVTEVADSFALSQPTVSNHAKVLREAGVIGRGKRLVVQQDALAELIGELQALAGPPSGSDG